jgi:DNA-binding transcriptional LysR family regulator
MIPTQRIEYLIAVAREGSFTRAAESLHVAQPAVSRQVRLLETQLGVRLLARTPRGVHPTAAGEALIVRAGGLIDQLERAVEEAVAVGHGERGALMLAYTASAGYETAPRLVAALHDALAGVEVRTTVLPREELLAAVRGGTVDGGIVRCPPPLTDLVAHPLRAELQGVLCRAEHPLLALDALTIAAIAGEPLLMHAREANPEHYDAIVSCYRAAGVEPRIRERLVSFDVSHGELLRGEALAIVGAVGSVLPEGLRWRALEPPMSLPIVVMTRPDNDDPLLDRALRIAGATAEELGW